MSAFSRALGRSLHEGSLSQGSLNQGAPYQGAPSQFAPSQFAPTQGAPSQFAPNHFAPYQCTPIQGAPIKSIPSQDTLSQGARLQGGYLRGRVPPPGYWYTPGPLTQCVIPGVRGAVNNDNREHLMWDLDRLTRARGVIADMTHNLENAGVQARNGLIPDMYRNSGMTSPTLIIGDIAKRRQQLTKAQVAVTHQQNLTIDALDLVNNPPPLHPYPAPKMDLINCGTWYT